jgi:hypothetical protein
MRRRLLLTLGWVWPFLVAGGGVVAIATGQSLRSDGEMLMLLYVGLLGSPAVAATIAHWLPAEWGAGPRHCLAAALAVPVVGGELLLAVGLLGYGANVAGPGWIE